MKNWRKCGQCLFLLLVFAYFVFGTDSALAKEEQNLSKITNSSQVKLLLEAVKGKRVGLITNSAGVDENLNLIADLLVADGRTTITAFFAPEHGLRGDAQAGSRVTTYIDPLTSIPVHSIYGKNVAPSDEQLKNVDVLVCDLQGVGVRFYTFEWTMTHCMEAAAKNHKKFILFDRPNPIGLERVEGAPNTTDYGLVGRVWPGQPFGVPTRHGLTTGELAQLVNGEWLNPKADLQVIPVPNYTRKMYFEDTHRPWVLPSPNMPTVDTAVVYPGMCVFEGTNISEGRGTTKPFEMVGAPYINGIELARELNALSLPGVRFRPAYFQPSFGKYVKQECGGIQVHVMNRETFDPIRTALYVLKTIYTKYPDQVKINSYAGNLMAVPDLGSRIKTESVDVIIAGWQKDLEAYKKLRAKYLLYP